MAFARSGRSLFAPLEPHLRTRNKTWLLVTTSAVMKARGTCFCNLPYRQPERAAEAED
jgi:hypothetical protein